MEEKDEITLTFGFVNQFGDSYKMEETVKTFDFEYQEELDFLLEKFKNFLLACGYYEKSVRRLQYLEDAELEYVLKAYGEWDG